MAMELLYENLPDDLMSCVGQEMIAKYYQKKTGEVTVPEFDIQNMILSDKGANGRVARDWGCEDDADADNGKENVGFKKVKTNAGPVKQTKMEKDAEKVKKSGGQGLMSAFFKQKVNLS